MNGGMGPLKRYRMSPMGDDVDSVSVGEERALRTPGSSSRAERTTGGGGLRVGVGVEDIFLKDF